jgi:hypothetical protein
MALGVCACVTRPNPDDAIQSEIQAQQVAEKLCKAAYPKFHLPGNWTVKYTTGVWSLAAGGGLEIWSIELDARTGQARSPCGIVFYDPA